MAPTLLLVEHAYQVDDFLSRGMTGGETWVALGVSAAAALDERHIPYTLVENYWNPQELEEIGLTGHRQVLKMSRELDAWLRERDPSLVAAGYHPFEFNIVGLCILFDGLRGRIRMLRSLLNAYPNHKIRIHRAPGHAWTYYGLGYSEKDTIWGQIFDLPGWGRDIDLLSDHPPVLPIGRRRAGFLKRRIQHCTAHSLLLTSLRRALSRRSFAMAWDALRPGNAPTALVFGGGIDWLHTLTIFRRRGWRVVFLDESYFDLMKDKSPARHEDDRAPLEALDAKVLPYAVMDQISFYPILKERIHWIARRSPGQYRAAAKAFTSLQQRYNIQLLLRSESPTGIGHAIERTAQNRDCRVAQWQHGMVTYHREVTQFVDTAQAMCANFTFVYGDGVRRAILELGEKTPSQVISVGSAALDTFARRSGRRAPRSASSNALTILYGTSLYLKEDWYFCFPPPWSNIHFYQDQKSILALLRELAKTGKVKPILKLHPLTNQEDADRLGPSGPAEGIRVFRDERGLTDLMAESDVIVLDCPSTSLLQALQSGLPVFVLMRHWRHPPEARQWLEKRAVCADRVEDLSNHLTRFLESGHYPADRMNDQFLRAFGSHLNDGKSAQRAVSLLLGRESEDAS